MVAFITNAEETALNNENAKQTQDFVQLSGIRNALNQRFFSVTKNLNFQYATLSLSLFYSKLVNTSSIRWQFFALEATCSRVVFTLVLRSFIAII